MDHNMDKTDVLYDLINQYEQIRKSYDRLDY